MPYISLTVKDTIHETNDVRSFILEPDDRASFNYKAGQFLTIVRGEGENEVRRSYSFSSHPLQNKIRITLKRIPNGEISRWLFDVVKPGDHIKAIDPSGLFTWPESVIRYDAAIFMAAGSGITPILSLVHEALIRNEIPKIYLVYSNSTKEDTVFLDEVNDLAKKYPEQLEVIHFFSNNFNLSRARLGRLALEEILSSKMKDPKKTLFFLCGPHVYMQNITITLLTEGVPEDNIRRELFFNPEPVDINEPPDKDMHVVHVKYEGKKYRFEVQYPKTILKTAKDAGVMLPFSCEAGRCGTCTATCTKGEVWMSRNEVLLDKEIAKGRTLTCTGYPVGGDVELEF